MMFSLAGHKSIAKPSQLALRVRATRRTPHCVPLRAPASGKVSAFALAVVGVALLAIVSFWFMTGAKPAPQVTFNTLGGKSFDTAALKGKVVLVNFWATSCVTCVAEMPSIAQTHQKFAAKGYETLAVAMQYDPPNYVLRFAKEKALPFDIALDTSGAVAKGFGDVRMTPTTFLIDKQGRIIKQYLGTPDFAELHALVERELKKPA
jgi:peroxiredoxin